MTTAGDPQPGRKPRVLRRVLVYSASRGVTEGLLGVRGVVLAALLGPAAFGIWALLRLVMRYATLVGLSVFRGLELELLAGRAAKPDDAPARVALGYVLCATGTLAAAAIVASVLIHNPRHVLVLRGFAVAIIAEQVYGYALVCVRVRQDLRRYAILENTHAALQVVCVLTLAWLRGLSGAFVGLALASLIAVAFASRRIELRPAFHWPTLRRLLREGVPLAMNVMLSSILSTADRWVVAGFGGVTMLGYYAFAAQIASVAVTFTGVIRTVIFPEVYRDARTERATVALRAHLERAVLPFARLFPPLLGAASLLVGPALALVLPRYLGAAGPARIFLLAGAASGIVNLAAIGVVAAGKQSRLPVLSGIALVINLALSFLAVTHGGALELVAAASFAGQVTFAAGVLVLVRRASGMHDVRAFLVRALMPLAWCTAVVAVVGHFLPSADPASAVAALAVYTALLVPLMPAIRTDWRRMTV
jgi:O-antigen/teichoic acid export membrane protein